MKLKKITAIAMVGLLALSAVGCTNEKQVIDNGGIEITDSINEASARIFSFEEVDFNNMPEEIQNDMQELVNVGGESIKEYDSKTYIGVFLGDRNSGGYYVDITSVMLEDGILKVEAFENTPAPTDMVTMAITYPLTIIEINEQIEYDSFIVNVNQEEHIPSLPTDEYSEGDIITKGRIVDLESSRVHLMNGCVISVYEFNGNINDFNLDDSVALIKSSNGNYLERVDESEIVPPKGVDTIKEISENTDGYNIGDSVGGGVIVQFDDNQVHIMSGDVIMVYDVSNNEDFYLGQEVEVIKGENSDELIPFIIEEFSVNHNSMGMLIERVLGTISKITENELTLETKDGEVSFEFYEKPLSQEGEQVMIDYMEFEDKSIIDIYSIDSAITGNILDITRSEEGNMVLTIENKMGKYIAPLLGRNEVNLSELKIGDEVTVYSDIMTRSLPPQIQTKLITQ